MVITPRSIHIFSRSRLYASPRILAVTGDTGDGQFMKTFSRAILQICSRCKLKSEVVLFKSEVISLSICQMFCGISNLPAVSGLNNVRLWGPLFNGIMLIKVFRATRILALISGAMMEGNDVCKSLCAQSLQVDDHNYGGC